MKNIKISLHGTSDFLKYTLLVILQGWRVVNIKRVPKPTEYTVTFAPPKKARSRPVQSMTKVVPCNGIYLEPNGNHASNPFDDQDLSQSL